MCSRVTTSSSRATSCGARRTPSTCDDGFAEADNIYWASDGRPSVTYEIAPTSRKVDPRLVDPKDGDLHLLPDSPAIDAIRPMDLGDIGAHGRRRACRCPRATPRTSAPSSTPPTPPPTPGPTEPQSADCPPSRRPVGRVAGAIGSGQLAPTAEPTLSCRHRPRRRRPTPRVTPDARSRRPSGGRRRTCRHRRVARGPSTSSSCWSACVGAGGLLVAVFLARRSPA